MSGLSERSNTLAHALTGVAYGAQRAKPQWLHQRPCSGFSVPGTAAPYSDEAQQIVVMDSNRRQGTHRLGAAGFAQDRHMYQSVEFVFFRRGHQTGSGTDWTQECVDME